MFGKGQDLISNTPTTHKTPDSLKNPICRHCQCNAPSVTHNLAQRQKQVSQRLLGLLKSPAATATLFPAKMPCLFSVSPLTSLSIRPQSMRCLSLMLLALCACHSLSTDQQQDLSMCQESARTYYRDSRLEKALGVCERGLAIDNENYGLRSLYAAVLLRMSEPASGSEHQLLDRSRTEFATVYATRSPSRHERHVLFVYSLARQKQGLRLTGEAAQFKSAGKPELAEQSELLAVVEYRAAAEMLEVLLERGEMQLLCHYHLMQIAASFGDRDQVFRNGEAYLKIAEGDQQSLEKEIDRTTIFEEETKQKRNLQQLRDEEIEVRTFLGTLLFDKKDYDGALLQLDAVLRLDSTRSKDHYNRARVLKLLGRIDEAKNDLRQFLATTNLPPDHPNVIEAAAALKQ